MQGDDIWGSLVVGRASQAGVPRESEMWNTEMIWNNRDMED